MKWLLVMLLAGCVAVAGAVLHAETITINNISAAAGGSVTVPVYISGGANVSAVTLAFSVGDGGSVLGGTETLTISSVDYLAGTIWSGHVVNTGESPSSPPVQSAIIAGVNLVGSDTVAASGRLMTFTIDLSSATPGEVLTLDPDATHSGLSVATDVNGVSVPLSFASGNLTVVPEPSSLVLCGIAALGLVAFRRWAPRRRA